ncbi:MAG: ABC transporter permease [Paludibacteraceae bacterium]|jgi:lipoprotein-releasing system permease protein|nr:ABC transporter permease [Paludibacteraceae bacterium]
MRVEGKIAWRYLFSKKSHNAINIVSGVSAAGVMVATAALVCVLSVMNGFSGVVEQMFSNFDPELRIEPREGKYFRLDSPEMLTLKRLKSVRVFSPTIEETALIQYEDHQVSAQIKGVSDHFQELTHIDSIICDGFYSIYDGAFERCVLGRGLASQLGISPHFVGGIKVYAPKRLGQVNLMRPDQALNRLSTFIAGTFAVDQIQYDDHVMIVSLNFARQLFEYDDNQATALELALVRAESFDKVKRQIIETLGDDYIVLDRYEQQADFFRISKIEKMLTLLLLGFILLIATFNIIGSLSMLMIDKQEDSRTLLNLGATPALIRRIFLLEGWLISLLGAAAGLVLGLVVCLIQQEFGILKLGNGTDYVLSAYPVEVQGMDILVVAGIVLAIGYISAFIPTRQLLKRPIQ